MDDLLTLLRACKASRDLPPTHVALSGGRFYVPGAHADALYVLYARALRTASAPLSLAEAHRFIGPVVIDLDFRQPSPARLWTDAHVSRFVNALLLKLDGLVDLEALPPEARRVFVLSKPAPRPASKGNNAGGFKDGLHLQLPGVVSRPQLQHVLRAAMLPCVRRVFAPLFADAGPFDEAQVYDEAVLHRNSWLMYGSKKPEEPHAWELAAAFQWDPEEMRAEACPDVVAGLLADARDSDDGTRRLVELLSIRNKYVESPLTPDGRARLDALLQAEEAQRAARHEADAEGDPEDASSEAGSTDATDAPDEARLEALLALLDESRADAYDSWRRVGLALHHATSGSPAGLRLWDAFSRRCSSKYDGAEGLRKLWDRMACKEPAHGRRPITVGTLCMMAKEDDPDGYSAWKAQGRRAQQHDDQEDNTRKRDATHALATLGGGAQELNEILRLEETPTWECLQTDGGYKLMPQGCIQCLVKAGYCHDTSGQSWVQVLGGTKACMHCHMHGQRAVTGQQLLQLLEFLRRMGLHLDARGPGRCGDKKETPFMRLRDIVLARAHAEGLRKRAGHVWHPVPGCPCAFEVVKPFGRDRPEDDVKYCSFLNETLRDNEEYNNDVNMQKHLSSYLVGYNPVQFPEIVRDRGLLSFRNGVLRLEDLSFTPYDGPLGELEGRVARHHIDAPYTGDCSTPLLDTIFEAQGFAPESVELLCAMLGRLLFPLNTLDKWQVMPYLVGVGGTGKSLLLNVVRCLLTRAAVGTLGGKREDVFGQANLVDKELVLGMDMPEKLSHALPQEAMQSMVSGEDMEVPRKGLTALHVTWIAPLALASNHMPDYTNTGNNVGRRLVVFNFEHVVGSPMEDLVDRIKDHELPNIALRLVAAYHTFRAKAEAAGSFWSAVPTQVIEWQSALASATNTLHRFLSMDPEERGWRIERVEGHVAWLLDFKSTFKAVMGQDFYNDAAVMARFGFSVSVKKENACLSCKQIARGGGNKCCGSYAGSNRSKKDVIYGMRLVPCDRIE